MSLQTATNQSVSSQKQDRLDDTLHRRNSLPLPFTFHS